MELGTRHARHAMASNASTGSNRSSYEWGGECSGQLRIFKSCRLSGGKQTFLPPSKSVDDICRMSVKNLAKKADPPHRYAYCTPDFRGRSSTESEWRDPRRAPPSCQSGLELNAEAKLRRSPRGGEGRESFQPPCEIDDMMPFFLTIPISRIICR